MSVHLFGIRHHGPGCARSLAQALQALQPDCILIEGPPEADELIAFAADPAIKPPVALLVYVPATPQRAVFYPFAEFSPEWQAMRYATTNGVPVRFCDLPQTHRLAEAEAAEPAEGQSGTGESEADSGSESGSGSGSGTDELHEDPLQWLANAAGFSDTDTWWDHLVEQRSDSLDLFAAIAEMMTTVRTDIAGPPDLREQQREAWMRNAIRLAEKQGHQRIAVVCGAYHVPALATMPSAKSDNDLLKGLPKVKLAATWTPWSYGRLAFRSGYGAGVTAPGWYHHMWSHPAQASLYWLTDVAILLRKHDLDASSASIIEAVRLADTLAAMRERPRPGLGELQEAVRAVFCYDSDTPLRLIHDALLINDRLGEVPPGVPTLPLPQDVQNQQKRLRLPVRADHSQLELDLRQPAHLEKSVLLHRLALLGVDWGRAERVTGKSGTFHEWWRLAWEPEFAIRLIEANVWGGNVEAAATGKAVSLANEASALPELTALIERVLLADLPQAVDLLMQRIQQVGALTPDVGFMLAALPPLAKVLRYGSVRGTDTSAIGQVVEGLVTRACIALPFGVLGMADEPAAELVRQLIGADRAIRLIQEEALLDAWFGALDQVAGNELSHPLISGRCARILSEQGYWDQERSARALALRCSHASAPLASGNWLEGFLQGSAALLLHNDSLWSLVNNWINRLDPDSFVELLPLLRRTFGAFEAPERRQLSERAGSAGGTVAVAASAGSVDEARARLVLPVLGMILGGSAATSTPETAHVA
ncbi:DUF5682 family protein [Massilia antarctica]|uniref:DUF5682 family protein n=1 Tax=Massilia antarctica TaxID=2765360 RepID=UPI0006BB686B|nr:DUF5682 family protein [Massilia sp. H27-R4]MCY0914076.1 DUF5682 family protein [Massilia sp. H27-R4]CUI08473.1 FIG01121542: hypothetical protein [Janthinobacterium sp. CG23_2]CUU32259.1 FIG01121542: hypothetical protein [Janthinobacterium sp. CG23_2]